MLKENWNNQDKLDYNSFNKILEILNLINKKLKIDINYLRNIKIGDDLSNKTLWLKFPNNLHEEMTNGELENETYYKNILTANQRIDESIWIGNRFSDICVNLYNLEDRTVLSTLYEYADGWYEDINLKEIKLSSDFGIVKSINTSSSAYKYIYTTETKANGDFLFAEDLQKIEDNLEIIAQCVNTSFDKRNWYYLSVISYLDINRWSILLNYAYEVVFEESRNIATEDEELLITEDDYYLITEGG